LHEGDDPTEEGQPEAGRESISKISNFTKILEGSMSRTNIILEKEERFESPYHSEKFGVLEKSSKNKSSMLSITGLKHLNSEEEEPPRSQPSEQ
jgi:hypothetical protein